MIYVLGFLLLIGASVTALAVLFGIINAIFNHTA